MKPQLFSDEDVLQTLIENFKLLATIFITRQTISIAQECSRENIEIFLILFGFHGTSSTNEKQIIEFKLKQNTLIVSNFW